MLLDRYPFGCVIFLQEFCNDILELPQDKIEKLHIRKNIVTGKPEVNCFALDMNEFLLREGNATVGGVQGVQAIPKYQSGQTFDYPVTLRETETIMEGNGNNLIYAQRDNLPYDYNHFAVSKITLNLSGMQSCKI